MFIRRVYRQDCSGEHFLPVFPAVRALSAATAVAAVRAFAAIAAFAADVAARVVVFLLRRRFAALSVDGLDPVYVAVSAVLVPAWLVVSPAAADTCGPALGFPCWDARAEHRAEYRWRERSGRAEHSCSPAAQPGGLTGAALRADCVPDCRERRRLWQG